MHENFTKEDVLLYIYNELEPNLRPDIEMAIATEPELLKFFQETLVLIENLKQIKEDPDSTIISILNEESRSGSMEIH